jgi:hypothetical protein
MSIKLIVFDMARFTINADNGVTAVLGTACGCQIQLPVCL